MSFDVNPQSMNERRQAQLSHAQQMLNLISQLGNYNQDPLPKYNYGGQSQQLNSDASKDFAATLLMASAGAGGGANRNAALQRRLNRP